MRNYSVLKLSFVRNFTVWCYVILILNEEYSVYSCDFKVPCNNHFMRSCYIVFVNLYINSRKKIYSLRTSNVEMTAATFAQLIIDILFSTKVIIVGLKNCSNLKL